jgi:hypothetical protein
MSHQKRSNHSRSLSSHSNIYQIYVQTNIHIADYIPLVTSFYLFIYFLN